MLALVIVPIATELPETLNSVLWVRTNDDTLAFGNVAGSATFQSCVLASDRRRLHDLAARVGGIISATLTVLPRCSCLRCSGAVKRAGGLLMLALIPWLVYVVAQVATGWTPRPSEARTIVRSCISTAPDSVEEYASAVTPFLEEEPSARNVLLTIIDIVRIGSAAYSASAEFLVGQHDTATLWSARQAGRRRTRCWCRHCRSRLRRLSPRR